MVDVAVLIPTYDRPEILERAMHELRRNVTGARPAFFVGNDHEKPVSFECEDVTVFNKPSGSLGANLNRLIQAATKAGFEILIQMDDDHILKGPLDLSCHINKLMEDATAGWIRLMGVGAHKLTADLDETYWRVRWDSDELYITSNRPHIKHVRFHEHFGLYHEARKLGHTEESFCHQCKNIGKESGGPNVLIPLTYDDGLWAHVGHSWQLEGF